MKEFRILQILLFPEQSFYTMFSTACWKRENPAEIRAYAIKLRIARFLEVPLYSLCVSRETYCI